MGNYIEKNFALTNKANFLTENIKNQVQKALKNKNSLISENRLWENMLSSQPLCFNLFGEMATDLNLVTKFFNEILPNKIDVVIKILFEHSEWRENKNFTGDKSAFDVFIEYKKDNKIGFLGIEVKYAESLREETKSRAHEIFENHKKEYLVLTTNKIFKNGFVESLAIPPLSQIWRDHLLALAVLKNKVYDEGCFIFLYPRINTACETAISEYKKILVSSNETHFKSMYLDDYINTLHKIANTEWSKELKERYL